MGLSCQLILQRLADVASRGRSALSLQCLAGGGTLKDRMFKAADALIENGTDGVFYYPAELPGDQMQLNRMVVDYLRAAEIHVVLVDRDIVPYPGRSELYADWLRQSSRWRAADRTFDPNGLLSNCLCWNTRGVDGCCRSPGRLLRVASDVGNEC